MKDCCWCSRNRRHCFRRRRTATACVDCRCASCGSGASHCEWSRGTATSTTTTTTNPFGNASIVPMRSDRDRDHWCRHSSPAHPSVRRSLALAIGSSPTTKTIPARPSVRRRGAADSRCGSPAPLTNPTRVRRRRRRRRLFLVEARQTFRRRTICVVWSPISTCDATR